VRLSANNRKALIALAIVVAIVAIVVPTCRMVGCSMGGAMPWGHHADFVGIYSYCGGTYVTSSAPAAIVPAGADSLVLALVASVVAAVALIRPPLVVQTVSAHASDPPPPPEDPKGERLLL
jgi:hypothetical protein